MMIARKLKDVKFPLQKFCVFFPFTVGRIEETLGKGGILYEKAMAPVSGADAAADRLRR